MKLGLTVPIDKRISLPSEIPEGTLCLNKKMNLVKIQLRQNQEALGQTDSQIGSMLRKDSFLPLMINKKERCG